MTGATILTACGLFVASMVCDLRRRRIPNALLALAGAAFALSLFALLPFEATRRIRRELPFALAIAPPAVAVLIPRVFSHGSPI